MTDLRELDAATLVALNRMITVGQVVPGIAHELNNSLQVISGLVEMLAGRPDLGEDVLGRLQRIANHTDRVSASVRELQAFARGDAPESGVIDLRTVVSRALNLRRYQLSRARVEVKEPDVGEPHPARGNAKEIQLLLLNIIINAEQALAGREGARIDITLAGAGGRQQVVIEDNGPGIPEERKEELFEPFATSRDGAAGLGLTAARTIARTNHGALTIEPRPGGGTRVVLELPGG